MQQTRVIYLAEQIGFSHTCALNMDALQVSREIRAMCSTDRCGSFDRSWSCPPACGSLETIQNRIACYGAGVLVQTTGSMEDEFDLSSIAETEQRHKAMFDALTRQAKLLFPDCYPMAAGACNRCKKCTYPDRPCRYPDKLYPSMEACGLWVSDVCKKSGMGYFYGPKTITFTACILTDLKHGV